MARAAQRLPVRARPEQGPISLMWLDVVHHGRRGRQSAPLAHHTKGVGRQVGAPCGLPFTAIAASGRGFTVAPATCHFSAGPARAAIELQRQLVV